MEAGLLANVRNNYYSFDCKGFFVSLLDVSFFLPKESVTAMGVAYFVVSKAE